MAIKTFTSGEVLTAADTNTYLANSGLVYITSGTLTSTATNFVDCFTSQYRDYFVTLSGVGTSAANAIWYKMLSGTTPASGNYYYSFRGLTSGGGSDDVSQANFAQGYAGMNTPSSGANTGNTRLHVRAPMIATATQAQIEGVYLGSGVYSFRSGQCSHDQPTAYNGIQFLTASAVTFSSGTVNIYGYRVS